MVNNLIKYATTFLKLAQDSYTDWQYTNQLQSEIYQLEQNIRSNNDLQKYLIQITNISNNLDKKINELQAHSKNKPQNPENVSEYYKRFEILSDLQKLKERIDNIKHLAEYQDFKRHYAGKNNFYIRFGKFSKTERSKIHLDQEFIHELGNKRQESGVSVYKAFPTKGKWLLIEPNSAKAKYDARFDLGFVLDKIVRDEIYLVTGDELNETGVDGEPLIINVFPVKKLSTDDIVLGNNQISLTEILKNNFDYKNAINITDPNIRKLFLVLTAIYVDEDPLLEKTFKDDEIEKFYDITRKSNKFSNLQNIDQIDLEFLKNFAQKYLKYRNKDLVFKGYRPFY